MCLARMSASCYRVVVLVVVVVGCVTASPLQQTSPEEACPRNSCQHRNDTSFIKDPCYCDALCNTYADCCYDSEFRDASLQKRDEGSGLRCVSAADDEVYAKATCGEGWSDVEVEELCVGGGVHTDPISRLLVTSTTTGHTYLNYHCAICNDDIQSLRMWTASLECGLPQHARVDEKDLVFRNDTWGVLWGEAESREHHPCSVTSKMPRDIMNLTRRCSNAVSTCSEDWQDEEVAAQCHAYTAVVYSSSNRYRNPHCAICNKIGNYNCLTQEVFIRFPKPFALLFDFTDPSRGNLVGSSSPCNTTHVWDLFFKRCRSIVCPKPNQDYKYGRCVTLGDASSKEGNEPTATPTTATDDVAAAANSSNEINSSDIINSTTTIPTNTTDNTASVNTSSNLTTTTNAPEEPNTTHSPGSDLNIVFPEELIKAPTTPLQDDPPTTPLQDDPPTTPLQDDPPTTPLQDDPPTTPLQDDPPTTSLQDDPPTTPLQDDPPTTPLLDDPPTTPLQDDPSTTPLQDDSPTAQVPTTPENPIIFPKDPPTTAPQDPSMDASTPAFSTATLFPDTPAPEADVFTNDSKEFFECILVLLEEGEFDEFPNGTVHVAAYGRTYTPGEYLKHGDGLLVCLMEEIATDTRKFSDALGWVSLIGLSLSCACLLLHLAAFALLPELRNHSGRNLASLCLALLAAYITLLVNMMVEAKGAGCTTLAAAMYYFFVTSFTWMNVIAFDVWYTFRLTQRQLRVSSGAQWHRFIAYSLYSWLLPGAATLVLVLVDQLEPSGLQKELLPRLAETWCWFNHRKALLAFFAAPMMILIVMNFVFFVSTAVIITQTGSTAAASSARGNNPRRQYTMYLRLAVLMGFTWVSGIAAGYLDLEALWYVFVLLNTLQGVFIFLAFTFRTRVWQGMGVTLTKVVRRGLSKVTRRQPPPDIGGLELSHTPETTSAFCSTPITSLEA
ncbi:uncharacterized protein LOC135089102 [Scylla paramamosain]|uniref:uncharacterized protein LOC135089102 n=1 Tax=Scylla paramamosain TaxID=85552 RepID=UPI003083A1AC